MLTAIVLVLAALLAGAGFGLVWRRLEEIASELRQVRALLEAREPAQQPAQQSATVTALARPVVVKAGASTGAPRREDPDEPVLFPLGGPSDDPFDDSWVVKPATRNPQPAAETAPAQRPAPAPRAAAIAPIRRGGVDLEAPLPSFPTPPRQQGGGFKLPPAPFLHALGAAAAMAAPATALAFGAPGAAVGAAAFVLVLAGLALSLRRGFGLIGWVAALGSGGWAYWAVTQGLALAAPWWVAGALTAAALAGLARAHLSQQAGLGGLTAAFMAAAAFAMAAQFAHVGGLAALGAIIAAAALLGASAAALELIHVGAWLAACAGLFLLGGRDDGVIWFAPACAWTGALFLGIAAVRTPVLGAAGTVLAATGALAPIAAALMLHAVGRELATTWEIAAALVLIGAALAGILTLAARRAGALQSLGWAAFPLGFGAPAAAALGALIALPAPFAATALAALAAATAFVNSRWPLPLWRLDTALLGLAAAASAFAAIGLFVDGARQIGWLIVLFGAAAPAALAFAAARALGPSAPISAMAFEALTLVAAVAAASGLVRLAYAPSPGAPLDFGEAGLHAAVWLAIALLVWLRAARGAWLVRQWGAAALAGAALCVLLGGPATVLNPLWGTVRDPAVGAPIANLLAAGFLAPALASWAHFVAWRGRTRAQIAVGAATVLTALWALLEIRRAFRGPDLAGPWSVEEFGAYAGAACAGVILWTLGRGALQRQAIRSSSTI